MDRYGVALGACRPETTLISCISVAATALLLVFSVASLPARGQQDPARLVGQVVDAESGSPLPTARVSLRIGISAEEGERGEPPDDRSSKGFVTFTDEEGRFLFPEVSPGQYTLRVTLLGHGEAVRELSLSAGVTKSVTMRLRRRPVSLPELEVSTEAESWVPGFVQRMERRQGHFVTRADVSEREPAHIHELFENMSGVYVKMDHTRHGYEKYRPLMFDRVGKGLWCRPRILVDGSPLPPYRALNEIPPERIIGMEVYPAPGLVPDSVPVAGGAVSPREPTSFARAWEPPPLPETDLAEEPAGDGYTPVGPPSRQEDPQEHRKALYPSVSPDPCGAILLWTSLKGHGAEGGVRRP